MAIFNSFTFDNENSLDSGIYITGEAVFNAPKRVVEMVNVPGRNGAIAIDEGRFENIPVKYPAGCFADNMADFAEKVENFRNILASRFTYKRLMDTYYPDEFRMGLYRSGLEVDVVNQARAGKFDIEFDCKPQRFLLSGEVPTEYIVGMSPSDEQTKTGSIVAFEAEEDTIISDVKVDINPIQDLHGYDKPWAGGNGKNKFGVTLSTLKSINTFGSWSGDVYTYNGVVFTFQVDSNGYVNSIIANGTSTGSADLLVMLASGEPSYNGMILSGCPANGSSSTYSVGYSLRISPYTLFALDNGNGATIDTQSASGQYFMYCRIRNGYTANNLVFRPMIRLASETDPTWEPYSNECPISGWDRVKIANMSDITNRQYFNGLLNGTYGFVDLGTLNWAYVGGGQGRFESDGIIRTVKRPLSANIKANIICSEYETITASNLHSGSNGIAINAADGRIWVFANGESDAQTFKTAMSGVYLIYELATPTTPTITEAQFNILLEQFDIDGKLYIINLKGTRYGAHIDVTSGVMTVDRKIVGSSEIKSYYTSWDANIHRYQAQFTGSFNGKANSNTSVNNPTNALCNIMDISASWNDMQSFDGTEVEAGMYHYPQWDYTRLYIILPTSVTTKTDAETWLDNSSIQVVYELATPITVQLTPTEVKTLLGTNNIWADSGDITVKYGTNPYLIINPTDFPSKPLLEVTGVGSFWLGDTQITITGTSGQIIYIDCETGECYKEAGGIISSANGLVTLNRLDFPELASGINNIQLGSGISKVKITPRWWRL